MRVLKCLCVLDIGIGLALLLCIFLVSTNPWVALKTSFLSGPVNLGWAPPESHVQFDEHFSASSVVFISCNRQGMPNPFWDVIAALNPTGIIWMGDNVYGDHTGTQKEVMHEVFGQLLRRPWRTLRALTTRSENLFPPASPSTLAAAYALLKNDPQYKRVLSSRDLRFLLGTWDDHDYGINDGDKTHVYRHESKQLFLDFFNVSSEDPRQSPSHPGIYSVEYHTIPLPPALHHKRRELNVSIVLLDTRFNKDPWSYAPETADFLGAQQWAWLESILTASTADVHLVVSSIQVLSEKRIVTESWDKFPNARKRLFNLILRARAKNVVFLSGDVHFAEIGTMFCFSRHSTVPHPFKSEPNLTLRLPPGFRVPLWEITSSGMTHSTRRIPYGFGPLLDIYLRWILPTSHVDSFRGFKQIWTGRNIGVLNVGWDPIADVPALVFRILDSRGRTVLRKDLSLSALYSTWADDAVLYSNNSQQDNITSGTQAGHKADAVPFDILHALDVDCRTREGTVTEKRSDFALQIAILTGALLPLFLLTSLLAIIRGTTTSFRYICRRPKHWVQSQLKKRTDNNVVTSSTLSLQTKQKPPTHHKRHSTNATTHHKLQ